MPRANFSQCIGNDIIIQDDTIAVCDMYVNV